MEDVLDLYAEPFHPRRPVVCFDERPVQLLADVYAPLPLQPGQARRVDYEYERGGTANLFVMCQPLAGWRDVKTTERRTKIDFAFCMKELVDVHFPEADVIRVVLDNLNTHTVATLIEIFGKAEADRLVARLTLHYTPCHASWVNIAEIELSAMTEQCLDRRLADDWTLWTELMAWEAPRNRQAVPIQWSFSWKRAKRMFIKDDTQAEVVQADA